MNLKVGDTLVIHCYKHNGIIYESSRVAYILDIKDDYIVFGNNRTIVVDSDGKVWRTKEPAIMFFFKDRWFNIIGQIKDYGVYFYCNIATPFLIDDKVIKYIEEAKVLDYFIESIAEFLVDAKIFKVSGNAFANGNFNYDLLKDNGEEKKEYKERVCDVILELAYETKNSILQDESKLDAYAANLAEFAYKLLNSEDVQSLYNDLVKIAENFENLRK